MRTFELCAYELVTVPLFEFADVVERGLGAMESHEVLRFVEPESGAVVSLRPDMTPQVARLLATRLAEAPAPVRLCYQGSVLRRRHERARRHRQIPQAGIELLGSSGPEGDLEVLSVAVSALRAAGLQDFVIDLGHARVAAALVEPLAEVQAREVLDALEVKDETEVVRRAERHGLGGQALRALAELPALHGGAEVWPRAERVLAGTSDPASAVTQFAKQHHAFLESHPRLPRLIVRELVDHDAAHAQAAIAQLVAGTFERLRGAIAAGQAAGIFRADLDPVASALAWCGAKNAFFQCRATMQDLDLFRHKDAVKAFSEAFSRLMLDGLPNLQDLDKLLLGENAEEMLGCDLKLELVSQTSCKGAIKYFESIGDYVSRDVVTDILSDTEDHIEWLETQLELVRKVGVQSYLQPAMGELGESDA